MSASSINQFGGVAAARPGVKSSEFWVGLTATVLPYLNHTLAWDVPVEFVAGSVVPAVFYIMGRTWLKVAGNR